MILALLMFVSSMPSYGAAPKFKDVPSNHWAYKDIEKMASIGYIAGKGDGIFDPGGILTFQEAMLLLARLTNPTTQEKTSAMYAHNALLTELNVDDWAKEGLAVALYKGIVTEPVLKNNKANIKKPISKLDTSIFLTKAMDLFEVAKNKTSASVSYRDIGKLTAEQIKCLSVLIEAKVLDPKGNGDYEFEPNSTLRRDVMAKMMSTAYDYMEKNPTSPTSPTTPEPPKEPESEKVTTTIERFSDVGEYRFLIVDNGRGGTIAYQLTKDTKISVDGKTASYLDLVEGQDVELSIKKGTTEILTVKAESTEETIAGTIKYLNSSGSKMTVEYMENKRTTSREFSIDSKAYIYLDGKSAKLRDLDEGDLVELEIKNNVIYDIEATSKEKDIEGIIKEITPVKDSRDKEYYIKVVEEVDSKEYTHEFLINSKTTIYREDRRAEAEDLKLKDEIFIKGEYNLETDEYIAYDIDAYVVRKEIKGVIYELQTRFQEPTKVMIYNQDTKKEESYILGKDVYIRVDRVVATSYELKIGYYVEVVIEGDEITEIEADSTGILHPMIGKILSTNSRTGRIVLEVQSFSSDNSKLGEEITIYADDVKIIDSNAKVLTFNDLYKGDTINVIGNYDGSTFIATTIILLR